MWISTYDDQSLKIGDRITYEIRTTNSPTNRTGDRNYKSIEISPEGEIISFNENGAFIGFTFDIYIINKIIFPIPETCFNEEGGVIIFKNSNFFKLKKFAALAAAELYIEEGVDPNKVFEHIYREMVDMFKKRTNSTPRDAKEAFLYFGRVK